MAKAICEKRVGKQHLNPMGSLHGGNLMKWMDEMGGVAAHCHSERLCTTVQVDSFEFLRPVLVDQTLVMIATVNRTWNTSLEVGIRAEVRDEKTGQSNLVASAYYVYVALDENRKPVSVSEFAPITDGEKQRWNEAESRRQRRLQEKLSRHNEVV